MKYLSFLIDQLCRHPLWGARFVMATQLIVWSVIPYLSFHRLSVDVLYHSALGRGLFKEGLYLTATDNTNLPMILTASLNPDIGLTIFPHYLVTQLFVIATFWFVYRLSLSLLGDAHKALACLLLLTGSFFFHHFVLNFNHNIAQYPFWVALPWMLWCATNPSHSHQKFWWGALGITMGVACYMKYSVLLLFILMALWLLCDSVARQQLRTPYPYLALLISLMIASPLMIHLFDNLDYPIRYALWRTEHPAIFVHPVLFLRDVFAAISPLLLMLPLAHFIPLPTMPPQKRIAYFVLLFSLGPVFIIFATALFASINLTKDWASPMMSLTGLLAIAFLQHQFSFAKLKRLMVCAITLLIYPLFVYPLFAGLHHHNYPLQKIAGIMEQKWYEHTDGNPLKIVAGRGDSSAAAAVTLYAQDKPLLLHSNIHASPWLTREDIHKHGALLIWNVAKIKHPHKNPALFDEFKGMTLPEHFVSIPNDPHDPIKLGYAIVKPHTFLP